jgi:hypothetical protein
MKLKSISELTDYYYEHFSDELEAFEARRKRIVRRYIVLNVVIALVALPVILRALGSLSADISYSLWMAGGTVLVWSALVSFLHRWLVEKYVLEFKSRIIRPLIEVMAPGQLHYYPANYVSRYQFQRSRLFVGNIEEYGGADLVKGELDGVHFQFSSVRAFRKPEERDAPMNIMFGQRLDERLIAQAARRQTQLLFSGFFMVAEFSKHFTGTTLVVPDAEDDNAMGGLGLSGTQSWLNKDKRVKMDSPLFEKRFNVYSSDPIEAHYLLTFSMMERILELQNMVGMKPLYLSFNGGHIYLAIAYPNELFTPSVFHSLKEYKTVLEYLTTIRNSLAIIETLQIATRIWSKAEGERSETERYLHDFDASLSPKT